MADSLLINMTEVASPVGTDITYLVDDPDQDLFRADGRN